MIRIGIDTGGTFTDFVVVRGGRVEVFKELSTPRHPEEAILRGLSRIADGGPREIIHGSTVGTNALLERKGARTALLTTAGFEDVLVIGRQTRRELYNIRVTRPEPLVPDSLRLGVRERVLHDGSIDTPLDEDQLRSLLDFVRDERVESLAVSLLFSFANTSNERRIAELAARLGIPISMSSVVLPEYREYERTSTTVINAYIAPIMSAYLGRLETQVTGSSLKVMQSNGGAAHARSAGESSVGTILSGPAGGVVGAYYLGQMCGYERLITFDMGGTSTDVALVDGAIKVTHESQVDGMPVGIPMMDIHTVGAGGGSIARLDPGGALMVGPESAGADPGPICYGRGHDITVTDANVILGRLRERFFLGGTMPLRVDRVASEVRGASWTKDWKKIEVLAQGVTDIVNNNMEQAIRLISVERGYDPRDFTLVCFGGAGGLHAAHLAEGLDIPRVLVPRHPGALSALGLLLADARKDYSQTLLLDASSALPRVRNVLSVMGQQSLRDLGAEGFSRKAIRIEESVDLRYRGQSYEITIPLKRTFVEDFHRAHEKRYGYSNPDQVVELVNVRLTAFGRTSKPRFVKSRQTRSRPVPVERADVWFDGRRVKTSIFDREALGAGNVVRGPAVIGEYSSTTLVPPGFECLVDEYLNLVIQK